MITNYSQFQVYEICNKYSVGEIDEVILESQLSTLLSLDIGTMIPKLNSIFIYLQEAIRTIGTKTIGILNVLIRISKRIAHKYPLTSTLIVNMVLLGISVIIFKSLDKQVQVDILEQIHQTLVYIKAHCGTRHVVRAVELVEDLLYHVKGHQIINLDTWIDKALVHFHDFLWDVDTFSSEGLTRILQGAQEFYNGMKMTLVTLNNNQQ